MWDRLRGGTRRKTLWRAHRGPDRRKGTGPDLQLHVICSDDSIILRGRARTYYAKQLAQKAALDLPDNALPLINEITVG